MGGGSISPIICCIISRIPSPPIMPPRPPIIPCAQPVPELAMIKTKAGNHARKIKIRPSIIRSSLFTFLDRNILRLSEQLAMSKDRIALKSATLPANPAKIFLDKPWQVA
jgi:hypothetical protein